MFKIFYNILTLVLYTPYIFIIFFRIIIKKEHPTKFREKILSKNSKRPKGFLFWFHVASIGEFKSIVPLVDYYLKINPKNNFLITTITLTSFYEFKKKYGLEGRVRHQFLPFDTSFLVNNFLENWKPDIVSFVDSEIWPNLIFKVKQKKIPLVLLNARITKKSFLRWKAISIFSKKIFESFSVCISSGKDTSEYLNVLGCKNIKYFGNIKFCSNINEKIKKTEEFSKIKNRKIWCALSTHSNEEEICGKVHSIIKKKVGEVLTVIIPRHVNRAQNICSKLEDLGFKVQIKNENDIINNSIDIVVINYYGGVSKYLKNINKIFIGKSMLSKFKNDGGQNPIEAAKMGCYIYHGPYITNFKDTYEFLGNSKLSEQAMNAEDLASKIIKKLPENEKINDSQIKKVNIYSSKIFDNVISEYNKFIK